MMKTIFGRINVSMPAFLICAVVGVWQQPLDAQVFQPRIESVVPQQLSPGLTYRQQTQPIDASQLRLPRSSQYFLDSGDVLGIFIDGVLGDVNEAPPVNFPPPQSDLPPSIGFPVVVGEKGAISLPLVEKMFVRGLTIDQVERLIRQKFLDGERPILTPRNRILVSLMRKRTVNVYVLRGDESRSASNQRGRPTGGPVNIRSDNSQRAQKLRLPAGDNDLLNALSQTGGLPGVNARADVRIYSDQRPNGSSGSGFGGSNTGRFSDAGAGGFPRSGQGGFPRTYRGNDLYGRSSSSRLIPTRQRAGERVRIPSTDVQLESGDVVVVEPRTTEVFYTSGLLRGGEFPIPRDRGLDVLEAVSLTGGAVGTGGFGTQPGTELIVVRRRPNQSQYAIRVDLNAALSDPRQRIQVRPGDVLVLRHSPAEQIRNFGGRVLGAAGLGQILGR